MHKITTIILLFVTFVSFNWQAAAQNPDIELFDKINSINSTKGYSTFVSESTTAFSIAPPVILGAVALFEKDDEMLKNALYIGSALVVDGVLTYSLKNLIDRKRAYITYPDLIEPYKLLSSKSMPSGHTSLAFATATALTLKYPKWYVIVPSYIWAGSVGYSRMNLGVHYPTDVLAGAALGAGSAYLTLLLNSLFWKKHNHKKLISLQHYTPL